MTLTELINYFRFDGNQKEFFKTYSLNTESEVIEIYMQKPFNIENNLAFFEIEKTEGLQEYEVENIKYYNLIDFYYFLDFIEDSKKNKKLTDKELAEILLDYVVNDA
ncbi:hypothetical protein H2O64_04260 [Kordia sp. YSTF-M3]|uniref:Uncharacterized protein n=1 Tax=Kordia aestuariivivens TaxID=2759037 RepID=A0ABR7Q5Q1_9FLAO|nr:hypothetical protein [Kordia aestuariivivens]MBC8753870.1 hypothetical protein [Kordia aestuariivivens]